MDETASDLLHELNQPLLAIENYARASECLLATESCDLNDVREALQQISAQAMRAGRLVRRLRALG